MNEYHEQAEQFLKDTETEFSIRFLYTEPYFPEDTDNRDVFEFTLKNARGSYASRFGDSIHNTQRRRFRRDHISAYGCYKDAVKLGFILEPSGAFVRSHPKNETPPPSAYDVLASLEKSPPGSFAEFCRDFGYDDQPLSTYPRVMAIYQACVEQYAALSRMFTPEQMDQLGEIS